MTASSAFIVILFSLFAASVVADADSSCTGTACISYNNGTITFSIEIEVNPDHKLYIFPIPITDISFLNPITSRNETILFSGGYPLSSGIHCNNSYYTASHDDLKAVHNTPIPIYVKYKDGSSILKDTQDICGFVDVEFILTMVGILIGATIFSCCFVLGLHYLGFKLRQRRAMAHYSRVVPVAI